VVSGRIRSLWRHPVKGFTPEPLEAVRLEAGRHVPFDRLFAVEDGPSGFDPAEPQHISKQKFTVLAKIAEVARIRTRLDDALGVFHAVAPGHAAFAGDLRSEAARERLAIWLAVVLADKVRGPLKVLPAPERHRFMDDEEGFVSIINLASVEALSRHVGRPLDPRRFRANVYVEGWPAWIENDLSGRALRLGAAALTVVKPIVRCVATHVDPDTGEKDIDVVRSLFEGFGHTFCGIYARVARGGEVRLSDSISIEA